MKLALFGIDIHFSEESLSVDEIKSLESLDELTHFSSGERTMVLFEEAHPLSRDIVSLAEVEQQLITVLVGNQAEALEELNTTGVLSMPFDEADLNELIEDFSLAFRPVEIDPSDFDDDDDLGSIDDVTISEDTMPGKKDEIELGELSDSSMTIDLGDSDDEMSFDEDDDGIDLGDDSGVSLQLGDESETGISLEELSDDADLELGDDPDDTDINLGAPDDEIELDDDALDFDLSPSEEVEDDDSSTGIEFAAPAESDDVVEDATSEFEVDLSAASEEEEEEKSGPIEFGYKDDEDEGVELAGNTTEFSVDGEEDETGEINLSAVEEDDEEAPEIDLTGDDEVTGTEIDLSDDEDLGFDLSDEDDGEEELSFDAEEIESDDVEIPVDLPEDDIPAPQAEKSVTGTVFNSDEINEKPIEKAPIQTTIVRDKIDYNFDENEMVRLQITIRSMKEEREVLLGDLNKLKSTKTELEQNNLGLKAEVDDLKIELALLKKRHGEQLEEASYQLRLSEDRKIMYEERVRKMQADFDQLNQKVRIDLNKVKHREKELESQLELIKMDSDAQIKVRDQKIMELKRKIDSLEFNMENMAIKEQKSKDDQRRVEERVQKVMKTLKGSMKILEDDIDLAISENDKNDTV